jgi:hypothetical protein
MDDLFHLDRDVQKVFQDKLDVLEKEPFKGSVSLPASRSDEPGWVSRVAQVRKPVVLEGKKYGALVYFTVGPSQLKVHGFALRLIEEESGEPS